jgi:hypothetical protein
VSTRGLGVRGPGCCRRARASAWNKERARDLLIFPTHTPPAAALDMSFPAYSPLFTLGLGLTQPTQPRKAAAPAPKGRPRGASLKSFLKLDTRDSAPVPPLPTVTPNTPSTLVLSPWLSIVVRVLTSPLCRSSPPPVTMQMYRRSRESLRSIPSPKPVPSERLPTPPTLRLGLPALSPASPMSSAASLPPATPPAPAFQKPAPARKSSCALGLTLAPATRPLSGAPPSVAPSSVASPRRRRVNRTAALALLEGGRRARNFMSLSDDEDDEPATPRSAPASPHAARASARRRSRAASDASALAARRRNFLEFDDDEDAYGALDAALRAVLGGPAPAARKVTYAPAMRPAQTFSSFIDVSA